MTATRRKEVLDRTGWRAWLEAFFTSDVGMKWLMALTGIGLLGYVLVHMLGNLKIFLGPEEINAYAEALRELGGALVPRTSILWIFRVGLISMFAIHIWAAAVLTKRNLDARGRIRYEARRQWIAANYASLTMRYSGVVLLLFVLYHLADLTWGNANPDFVRGDVYHNVIASFSRPEIALLYLVAQVALAFHVYHGAWSLWQSMGVAGPRIDVLRRYFATAFAVVVFLGNSSIPLAVQLGVLTGGSA